MSELTTYRNLETDPRCLKQRPYGWHATAVQREDGLWTYTMEEGATNGTMRLTTPLVEAGMVVCGIYQAGNDLRQVFEFATESIYFGHAGDLTVHACTMRINERPSLNVRDLRGILLHRVLVCTPADWQRLLSLYQTGRIGLPWFAGPADATEPGIGGVWEL